MIKKYRICRRYSPSSGTWYIIQKKRLLFGWHTLNITFDKLHMANQYLELIKTGAESNDDICETPLIWNEKKGEFIEKYPCKNKPNKSKVIMKLWKVIIKTYVFGIHRYTLFVLANTESEMLNTVEQYPIVSRDSTMPKLKTILKLI